MTQKEFEDRIGRKVDSDDFEYANGIYMSTSMDKDAFCQSWKGDKMSIIDNLRSELMTAKVTIQDQHEIMVRCAHKALDNDMTGIAVDLIGRKESIIYKAKKGILLTDADVDYLISELH